ncbi:MAG TPA: cache domain-containing protein, partial [Candidatus Binatia bacterium]|nr:cache domain-containing protein [Candidatus Binatia bacterium]
MKPKSKNARSLRVRLIQLVLLALLPASVLIIYGAREQRRNAAAVAEAEALRLARILAASHQRLVDSTRHFLVALARIPEIRKGEPAACTALLSDLIEQYPPYSNLAVAGVSGKIFCQARPSGQITNISDRGYFQRALKEQSFSIGEYQIGRITGRAGLNFGYPVLSKSGTVSGIVYAAIDLAWLENIVSAAELPEGSTLTIFDRHGTVLARHPESEKWVGKPAGDSLIFRTVLARSEGVTDAPGLDEIKRLYGFTSFGASPSTRDIYLTVGIPADVALAAANWTLQRNLAALLGASVLALVAAWYAGAALILRPLKVLLDATAKVADGKLSTRTGLPHGEDEMGRLAAAFDKMAESLEREKADAEIAALRTSKSLQRIKALHEIDTAISSTLDLRAILGVLFDKIDSVLPGAITTVRLIDRETGEFAPVACRNMDEDYWRAGDHRKMHGLARQVVESRLPVTVVNMQKHAESSSQRFIRDIGLVSYLGVPLIAKGDLLGIIAFYTKEEHVFDTEEKDFLVTLSGQLA